MNNLFKSIIFLFFLFPGLSEAGRCYAQENTLTLNLSNVTVKEAFAEIEKLSQYVFIFNDRDVDLNRKVSLNVKSRKIDDVLQELFKASDNVYLISGRQITVQKKPVEAKPPKESGTNSGVVLDENGDPVIGVSVSVKGTSRGTTTDGNGAFSIQVQPTDQLEFSYLGYQPQTLTAGQQSNMTIRLVPTAGELDEVMVVAFAKQKKNSVVASISTITPKDIRVPSSNLTTAFAGRIAGLISYQRTGEPGQDNAEFFIRGVTTFGTGKKNPLILIDGVEMTTDDLARLTTDDLQSFSIMKDANATALYGARGANGVIMVTTKEGREGKATVSFRAEGSLSAPTSTVKIADPLTYMRMHNEAVRTRDAMVMTPYSSAKIYNTERGSDPLYYPATDWMGTLFSDHTFNHRYNLNVSGGGTVARYYIAASYAKENGILNVDKHNSFNNNIDMNKYSLRSNVNVNLTKTTEVIVRLQGAFDYYTGPLDGGTDLYWKAINANPVFFQPSYPADEAHQYERHVMFGNYEQGGYLNPYSEMLKGYKESDRSNMFAQFELKQNLDFIAEGLSARAMFNVNRYLLLETRNSYRSFFYSLLPKVRPDDPYMLSQIKPDGTDYLEAYPAKKELTQSMYVEAALQYSRALAEKHNISALLVYTLRESKDGNATNLQGLLPHRNLGLAGRLTYSYDDRYFLEGNFGYNGSERFSKNERFGFFPSVGGGWIASNESFMEPLQSTVSKLKFKATYGLVGNDDIGSSNDRFFYLAQVNMRDYGLAYTFGRDWNYHGEGNIGETAAGISIGRYPDPHITWEISRKTNLGMELNLWNALEVQVDYFLENRSKILQRRSYIPSLMGLQGNPPSSNIGEAHGQGIDMSVDYSKSFTKNFWTVLRGNFTYATSKYTVYEEPDYLDTPWRRHYGKPISQTYGYVAERLFIDDNEVANSPKQFGNYLAGDIKYKDINGDMVIDDNDLVPIGYPTTPEINYGFGISAGYKSLDFSCFFQGSARSSFWIDPRRTAPFSSATIIEDDGTDRLNGLRGNRALMQHWADSHWSEDSRDIYALWPRFSPDPIDNNMRTSTWFMRDGTFLRLKTVEIGYALPKNMIEKAHLTRARFYLSGNNLLLVYSKFKMWDVEMAGNGFAYPLQRIFNVGLNVEF